MFQNNFVIQRVQTEVKYNLVLTKNPTELVLHWIHNLGYHMVIPSEFWTRNKNWSQRTSSLTKNYSWKPILIIQERIRVKSNNGRQEQIEGRSRFQDTCAINE